MPPRTQCPDGRDCKNYDAHVMSGPKGDGCQGECGRGSKDEVHSPQVNNLDDNDPPKEDGGGSMATMAEEAKAKGHSHFRGHPTFWANDRWSYMDNGEPIPGWGGESRPCAKCGSTKWSGDGHPDDCLGMLPGVNNACCGHGIPEEAYISFTNGTMIRGFTLIKENDHD